MAKKESHRRASKKYQATRQGQLKNAARQQAFRNKQRQKQNEQTQKVTHQGSPGKRLQVEWKTNIKQPEKPQKKPKSYTLLTCHQCDCPCDPGVRLWFLNRTSPHKSN